jgi:hypothetical protein
MAINFLNTVDLNKNQLNNARIQNLAGDPTAVNSSVGQIYFNTADDTLKQYVSDDGTGNPGWVEVGATSGVESFTNTSGTYVAFGTDNAQAIGNVSVGTIDLTAVDGTSTSTDRFLTKNNKWATIPFGDITEVQGGTYINVTDQTGPIPIVNHDTTARTDTTSTQSPGYGVSFTSVDSVTTNTTGHVTSINVKTVTLPATENETYTLPVSAGAANSAKIDLTAGGTGSGIKSTVEFLGTTGRIAITENVGNNGNITIDFPDDVTIVDDLTVGGELTVSGTGQSSFGGQVTIPQTPVADTDAASKKFVLDQVAGLGSFQGGYDASTDPGSPVLTGASNIAFGQGDFYAVTTAGTITFSDSPTGDATLEVGDFIFANSDIAANSDPASTEFTLILADQNIAGSGATDGATPKGVAGFDSANFDVSATGWVQLNSQRNPYGAKQSLNNTSPSSRVEAGGVTTFTIDLADSSLFGTGALAENVKAEVTDGASPYQTVFAEVTRSGSASISIAFVGSVANDAYQVLLTYI